MITTRSAQTFQRLYCGSAAGVKHPCSVLVLHTKLLCSGEHDTCHMMSRTAHTGSTRSVLGMRVTRRQVHKAHAVILAHVVKDKGVNVLK